VYASPTSVGRTALRPLLEQTTSGPRISHHTSPYDRALTDLIGELSTRSEEFRVRWAAHDVRQYRSGTQPVRHPRVGDLTLSCEALDVRGDIGQIMVVYTAEPDALSQDALNRLANWSPPPNEASRPR
jgi:MmyB-like transcription regulator ligand binding domain